VIIAFVDDLLFRSKLRAVAAHTGAEVTFARTVEAPALAGARLAIVDLDGPSAIQTLGALMSAAPSLRIVGFVSHVNAERIRAAREAGIAEVMARSAFVSALPTLLA
jgi:hypothetical protein